MSRYEELKVLITVVKRKIALMSTFNLIHQIDPVDYLTLTGDPFEITHNYDNRVYLITLSDFTKIKLSITVNGHVDTLESVRIVQGLFEFGIDMVGVTDITKMHNIHGSMIAYFKKLLVVLDEYYKLPGTNKEDRISTLETTVVKLTKTVNLMLKGHDAVLKILELQTNQIKELEAGAIQTLKDLNTLELK